MSQIPVGGEADVVVFGSGPSGISASMAAARQGAKVILVEKFPFPGGMSTVVPVSMWPIVTAIEIGELEQSYDGFANELVERLKELDAIDLRHIEMDGIDSFIPNASKDDKVASSKWYIYDPEMLKNIYFELLEDAGVELMVNTFAVGTVVKDDKIEGVEVETLTRRELIKGKVVLDCTGSADIVTRSGKPTALGRETDGMIMPTSTTWRIAGVDTDSLDCDEVARIYEEHRIKGEIDVPLAGLCMHIFSKGVVQIFGTRVFGINPLDPREAARGEKEQRRQIGEIVAFLRKTFPEFANCRQIDTGAVMGMIGTRRISGDYFLTREDILEGKKFDDVVATGTYRLEFWDLESGTNYFHHLVGTWYTIPYRCMLPKGLENVIVAGSSISGQYEAMAAWAIMPVCFLTGQAAGTAAVLCIENDITPREVNVRELQQLLKKQGVFLG